MITALILIPGLLMVAVGIVAAAYWYRKKHSKIVYFAAGALFWVAAIAIKVIMDLTISMPLNTWLGTSLPVAAAIVAAGLYVGLRTGLLECGAVYLGTRYTKLKNMSFDDAVAVGIGFGGIEAIMLGLMTFLNAAVVLLMPDLVATLPASALVQYELLLLPLPIIERVFVLFTHVFVTVLAIYAVKLADLRWLGISVVFKTALDGALPLLAYYLGTMGAAMYFLIEGYIVLVGIIALAGLYWFHKKYGSALTAPKAREIIVH